MTVKQLNRSHQHLGRFLQIATANSIAAGKDKKRKLKDQANNKTKPTACAMGFETTSAMSPICKCE
jgi:hypothetical protein